MASASWQRWTKAGARALDELEQARAAIGPGRGRRYATQQIDEAYVVLLSSHFQKFCRDLHSEATMHLVATVPTTLRPTCRLAFTRGRKLDTGNPNAGNLGSDFGAIGMTFWDDVRVHSRYSAGRQVLLEQLAVWRNAIAHQDFAGNATRLAGRDRITLGEVRRFRNACAGLAQTFDAVVLTHIKTLAGPSAGW